MVMESFNKGQTVFAIQTFDEKNNLESLHDVVSTFAEGKQIIESVGNDPALLLPSPLDTDRKSDQRIVVKIILESSVSTNAKLYFTRKANEPFTESDSLRQKIAVGRNTLFYVLPKEFRGRNLRYDPGECLGTFVLAAVEVKAVDEKFLRPYLEPAR
jgi:hypothetical protein